ncbi:MAG: hypothetical protein AAFO69_11715 [Bacteroidota bacterium]
MSDSIKYEFPVKNRFEAREVTDPLFQPDLFDEKALYVNLDDVRGDRYLTEMLFELGVNQTFELSAPPKTYTKILFSGHRGCGKSAELQRLHNRLNSPKGYISIMVDLEEDADFARFQPEDFYLLLLLKLLERMEVSDVKANSSSLKKLAEKLQVTTEVKKELASTFKVEASAETGGGIDLLGFLKSKANFKSVFSGENKSSTFIRQEIKRNINEWIRDFNMLLVDVREAFIQKELGRDLLFIVDGSEKLRPDIYKELFVTNGYLIQDISANIILAVPINAYYGIIDSPQSFHSRVVIPMIPLGDPAAVGKLKEIITKRIDQSTFLEEGAFGFLIEKSGGCIRQLLILINRAIVIGFGEKIDMANAQVAVKDMGNRMSEGIRTEHIELIKSNKFNTGDNLVRELLYGLVLLKYNGADSIRLNPVLNGLLNLK